VSGSKQGIVVSRSYNPAVDQCTRALALLLKEPVSKEGGPAKTAPDDAERRSSDGAKTRVP
jgi:hypothetical protein